MSGIFAGILSWSHFLTEKDIIILMITIWPYWDSLSNAEENEKVPVQNDKKKPSSTRHVQHVSLKHVAED